MHFLAFCGKLLPTKEIVYMATEKNDAKDFEQTNDYTNLPLVERVTYETKSIRKFLKGKTPLNMLLNCQNYSENKELFAN